MEDYDEEETLLLQVRHRLWGHEELEKKCTLLNDDMMLIEDRGRIFFARREGRKTLWRACCGLVRGECEEMTQTSFWTGKDTSGTIWLGRMEQQVPAVAIMIWCKKDGYRQGRISCHRRKYGEKKLGKEGRLRCPYGLWYWLERCWAAAVRKMVKRIW